MRRLTISQTRAGLDRAEFQVTEGFLPVYRASGGLFSREHGLELSPADGGAPPLQLRYDPGANLRRALSLRRKTWVIRRDGVTLGTVYQDFRALRPNRIHLNWQGRRLTAEHISLGVQGCKLVIFENGRQLGLAERDPVTENHLDQYQLFCLKDGLAEAMVLLVLYYDWYWFNQRGSTAHGTQVSFYRELFSSREALYDPTWTDQFFVDDPAGRATYAASCHTQGQRSRRWMKYTKRILLAFALFWALVLGLLFFTARRTVTRPVYTFGDDTIPSLYAAVGSRELRKSSMGLSNGRGGSEKLFLFVSGTPEADVRAYQAILTEEWTVSAFDTGFYAWRRSEEKPEMCLTLRVAWVDDTVMVDAERTPSEHIRTE